ncbi:ribonuclease Z [Candidatus Woesearchaeota archaeon]|nr:ribonuclease Z [Candidatus Woesearchaeota archaeon]
MEIIFLGTSGMHPTKERNLFSVLFRYKSENILIDCGEGTQRQLRMINIPSTKTNKILLTHLHGDHINGLPGLLQNLQANQYSKDLEIYGPVGLKKLMYHIFEIAGLRMRVKINEIKSGIVYKSKDFYVEAKELQHSSKVYGYSFTEHDKRKINMNYLKKFNLKRHVLLGNLQKGKDVVYNGKKIKAKDATTLVKGRKLSLITDTVYCDNCIKLAKDSDLLVCECTFSKELKDKAKAFKHLTSEDAANIAKKSKSKKLILTHFSQRYKDTERLVKEAKKIFKNTVDAKDFMKAEV